MYRNHLYPSGEYYAWPAGHQPDAGAPAYPVLPSARRASNLPYDGAPASGPGVPAYADAARRPVYQRQAPPPAMFGATQRERLSARLAPPVTAPPNPFTPLAPLRQQPPASHYLQPAPTVLYNPFYLRPLSPVPAQPAAFEFSGEEVALLRAAGFRYADRRALTTLPERQFQFVMRNAGWLAEHRFDPDDIIETAQMAPSERDFVAREACTLDRIGLHPGQAIDLARMAYDTRRFVVVHGAHLRDIGFSPIHIMVLASRPAPERRYVVDHGMNLRARGHSLQDIRRQARNAALQPLRAHAPITPRPRHAPTAPAAYSRELPPGVPLPLPAVRHASTSALPRPRPAVEYETSRQRTGRRSTADAAPGLSLAEREGFEAMGLASEALERLAGSNDTVRTYVLVHGSSLLAGGMSFDEIIGMAQDTAGMDRQHADAGDLPALLSRLDVRAAAGAGAPQAVQADLPRTRSPERLAPQHVTYPRNDGPLADSQRTTLLHAHTRWARNRATREDGEQFYRDTVPAALAAALAPAGSHPGAADSSAERGFPNLSLLLAGVAYAEDNHGEHNAVRHRARVKALTGYLASAGDPALLRDCDSAAAEGVTHCGDRVAYGLTRVEQVVMQRRIAQGELPPRALLEGIESIFLQPRVENIAAHLANARRARGGSDTPYLYTREGFAAQVELAANATFTRAQEPSAGGLRSRVQDMYRSIFGGASPAASPAVIDNSASESLEMYAALVPQLIARGVNLVESARTSAYGGMYRIEPLELDYACVEIERHVRGLSDDFLQEFEGNSAVEKVLRQCFQDEFRTMRAEREEMQDQADDALFDADAPSGTQETVRDIMAALATMEKEWYRDKLKLVLAQRHLLDDLQPLAPDLAGD